jgi:hypothetical protein
VTFFFDKSQSHLRFRWQRSIGCCFYHLDLQSRKYIYKFKKKTKNRKKNIRKQRFNSGETTQLVVNLIRRREYSFAACGLWPGESRNDSVCLGLSLSVLFCCCCLCGCIFFGESLHLDESSVPFSCRERETGYISDTSWSESSPTGDAVSLLA